METGMRSSRLIVFAVVITCASPARFVAQEADQSLPEVFVSALQEGKLSGEARYRFETNEREGLPFTGDAYAATLRLALGYETLSFHRFSGFVQGAGVLITGPADYSVPTLPPMNRPDRPAILDPKTVQLSQGYLKWK